MHETVCAFDSAAGYTNCTETMKTKKNFQKRKMGSGNDRACSYSIRAAAGCTIPLRREDSTACIAERRSNMQLFIRTGMQRTSQHRVLCTAILACSSTVILISASSPCSQTRLTQLSSVPMTQCKMSRLPLRPARVITVAALTKQSGSC